MQHHLFVVVLILIRRHLPARGDFALPGCDWGLTSVSSSSVQVITESMGEKYLAMKLKDQERAIAMLAGDPQLAGLRQVCDQTRHWDPADTTAITGDVAALLCLLDTTDTFCLLRIALTIT